MLGSETKTQEILKGLEQSLLRNIKYSTKFGGAVGNINAHYAAYPDEKWDNHFSTFMNFIGLYRDILTNNPTKQTY